MKKTYKFEITITSIILVISIYFLLIVDNFKSAFDSGLGPTFWPKIVLWLLIILSSVSLIRHLINKKEVKEKMKEDVEDKKDHKFKFYFSIVLTVLYITLLEKIGFIFLTPFYLFSMFFTLGYRKKVKSIFAVIILSVILALVFPNLMNLPLPRGTGYFRQLSFFIY